MNHNPGEKNSHCKIPISFFLIPSFSCYNKSTEKNKHGIWASQFGGSCLSWLWLQNVQLFLGFSHVCLLVLRLVSIKVLLTIQAKGLCLLPACVILKEQANVRAVCFLMMARVSGIYCNILDIDAFQFQFHFWLSVS